jgi:Icc-related predicted phosphoesterase
MIIDCIGCLHGARPDLKGGDILIVTGDLTTRDDALEYGHFAAWLQRQNYKKKILVAGNHDNFFQKSGFEKIQDAYKDIEVDYLCDSGVELVLYPSLDTMEEGKVYDRPKLKVWGSPWTSRFKGINPKCCAFTGKNDEEIAPHFALIPDDVDILITHSPPFTIRDKTKEGKQVGSPTLMAHHISRLRPKLWAFSHIHEDYGVDGPYQWAGCRYVNCSIMNERYQPVNAPIRIVLADKDLPSR